MPLDTGHQFEQLCNDSRHIDRMIWIVPTIAYPTTLLGSKAVLVDLTDPLVRMLASAVVLIVFFAFVYQFARYQAYQVRINKELEALENEANLKNVTHHCGLKQSPRDAGWQIRLSALYSSGNIMFYVMLLTLIAYLSLAIVCTIEWTKTWS